MASRQQLEQIVNTPNARKFLDLISFSEGTQGNGYATAFGGGRLGSLADHPRYRKAFKQKNGQINYTSAAGRYQFLTSTWDGVRRKLGLQDFSQHSQDLGALQLLDEVGALGAVVKGDYQHAVTKAGAIWASFPTAPDSYSQPKHSWQKFHDFWAGRRGSHPPNGGQSDYRPAPLGKLNFADVMKAQQSAQPPKPLGQFKFDDVVKAHAQSQSQPMQAVEQPPQAKSQPIGKLNFAEVMKTQPQAQPIQEQPTNPPMQSIG